MHRRLAIFLVPLVFLVAGAQARANYVFTVQLRTDLEPPPLPNNTTNSITGAFRPSGGTVTFAFNESFTSLSFSATVFGVDLTNQTGTPVTGTPQSADLNDNLTAAHIHASSTLVPGSTAVAGVVWGFFGSPLNDTTPNDVVITPTPGGLGGTISGKWDPPEGNGTNLATQLPNLLAGRAYINFHTSQNPGGEFRAFLVAIPEPSSIVLFGIGTAALVGYRWRPRRTR